LLAAPERNRTSLAKRAVDEGLTVRALERLAGAVTMPKTRTPAQTPALSPEERDFESRLRERFGTHVAIVRSARSGGRIEFRFGNDDELARLGDLLLGEEP
jgi:ParB family chromosome partitioning protein